jgi:hypothetical protein
MSDIDPSQKIIWLKWSEPKLPCNELPYDHVIAETPFGRILITWKGWKEYDSPTIDEFPGVGWLSVGFDLDDAKDIAEREWNKRVSMCIPPNAQITGPKAPVH